MPWQPRGVPGRCSLQCSFLSLPQVSAACTYCPTSSHLHPRHYHGSKNIPSSNYATYIVPTCSCVEHFVNLIKNIIAFNLHSILVSNLIGNKWILESYIACLRWHTPNWGSNPSALSPETVSPPLHCTVLKSSTSDASVPCGHTSMRKSRGFSHSANLPWLVLLPSWNASLTLFYLYIFKFKSFTFFL